MKQLFVFAVLFSAMSLSVMAQDDLYFSPKKKAQTSTDSQQPAYYVGSNRDVDEYNRRGKYWSHTQKIGSDEQGNDIIQFQQGNGVYPDSVYIDTTFVSKFSANVSDDDFAYSRRMSRWDGYYDPWFYNYAFSPYYWRSAWYDPWYYGGFYDPWYAGYYGYYGWYGPYAYGGWRWPGYYGGWYWPGYWGGAYITHYSGRGGYAGYRSWSGSRPSTGRGVTYNGTRSFGNRNNQSTANRTFGNRNNNNTNTNRQNSFGFGNRSNSSMSTGSFGGGFGGSRGGGFGGGHSGASGGGGRFGGGHR